MKHSSPHILLVNPWITDFAAYNLWIKPLGLLSIAGLLRQHGFQITLVDCLDFPTKKSRYGDGKFFRTIIEKPKLFSSVPRNYSQYGIPEPVLMDRLVSIDKPDLIGITSGMTYWYPGLFKVIRILKQFFKDVPIVLGGIYATLCYDHARRYSGADFVFQRSDEFGALKLISELTSSKIGSNPLNGIDQPSNCNFNSLEFHNPKSEILLLLCPTLLLTSIHNWTTFAFGRPLGVPCVVRTAHHPFFTESSSDGTLSTLPMRSNIGWLDTTSGMWPFTMMPFL